MIGTWRMTNTNLMNCHTWMHDGVRAVSDIVIVVSIHTYILDYSHSGNKVITISLILLLYV